MVVDITLINITRLINVTTVSTGKDTTELDGRTCWHIHNRTASDTLIQTTAIGCTNLSASQVDDSSCRHAISISVSCLFRYTHTHATVLTSSEHFQISKFRTSVSKIHQHIAAVLHLVLIRQVKTCGTLSCSENLVNLVAVMLIRLEVDESILHTGRCIASILRSIVIVAITATEDIVHMSLHILHVGRSCRYSRSLLRLIWCNRQIGTQPSTEVRRAQDVSTEVISAIDMVTDIGETEISVITGITSHISLGMSEDVGIT